MSARSLELRFRPWRTPRHRALWVDEALARENDPPRTLRGAHTCDVCIVGGGYTGLWTAIRLLDQAPTLRVTVVEADRCGTGASGRNGGAVTHWWAKLATLIRRLGPHDAVRVLDASIGAVADIGAFVAEHGIECDARVGPSVWSVTTPGAGAPWDRVIRAGEAVGRAAPFRLLSPEELRASFGTGPYFAGVVEDGTTRLQPALLARGLRRAAMARGAEIFEQSPVSRITGEARRISVTGGEGVIHAGQVVLAANAWMAHLSDIRPQIMVMSSDIVVSKPVPEVLRALGMQARPGGVNARLMLNYGGLTPDGRVFVGRGGGTVAYRARIGRAFDHSATMTAEVTEDFRHLYPELRDVPIDRGWAGPVDRTATGLPWFGQLQADPRIHYGIGYSGQGVAATGLGGRILAAHVLGKQDQWADLGRLLERAREGRYPPDPLRYVAGRLVQAAVAQKETAERDGRTVTRLDASLSRLAQASLPLRRRHARIPNSPA